MTVPVQFLFDFGSPNAYLCHRVIPGDRGAHRRAASITCPSCSAGIFKLSGNRSPVEAFGGHPEQARLRAAGDERFVAKHQLDAFRLNPTCRSTPCRSCAARWRRRSSGCFERYVEAVFAAMWERGQQHGRSGGHRAALNEAGLDAERLSPARRTRRSRSRLMANTQAAFERGAFGSPTFFVGSEIFFGKDRLREVEEEIVRRPTPPNPKGDKHENKT